MLRTVYSLPKDIDTYTFTPLPLHPHTYNTMELTEKEWAVRIRKYKYRINADKAIKDELVEFVQTEIYVYETDDFTDRDLFFIF